MTSKTYTAQEMREEAAEYAKLLGDDSDTAAMLRQAAEMRERCENEIAKLRYPPSADDVVDFKRLNYILRGDAGKEERSE